MKIIFICGSLEPGRDGVGDYIRRLSNSMIRNGHEVAVLAINDRYRQTPFKGIQFSEEVALPVFRLPSNYSLSVCTRIAAGWINEIDPDLLSLQFVPFAFHTKGLPLFLTRALVKIAGNRKWHIMFHELWVGMDKESPQKHLLLGIIQQKLIRTMIKSLRPVLVHTQTRLYQQQLDKLGVTAHLLPLFSNIPVAFAATSEEKRSEDEVSMVLFGSIHPGAPVTELAKEAAWYAKRNKKRVCLILLGNCGEEKHKWIRSWESEGLPVKDIGECSEETISEVLSQSSAGISTTVTDLVEKSGSVAAMLAHGLPVLNVSRTWSPRGIKPYPTPPGVFRFHEGVLDLCFSGKAVRPHGYHVSEVSEKFEEAFMSL